MTTNDRIRIAVFGNLANVGYKASKYLREAGADITLYVLSTDFGNEFSDPSMVDSELNNELPDWVRVVDLPMVDLSKTTKIAKLFDRLSRWTIWRWRQIVLWKELRQYDLIHSVNMEPAWLPRINRPYVGWATGSDLWETAGKNDRKGKAMKARMRKAAVLLHQPDPLSVKRVIDLKIPAAYPTRLAVDIEMFKPTPVPNDRSHDELLIFHPSRQDWVNSDNRQIKANDRFFRGFAQFIEQGHKGKVVYVERGDDVEATRELIDQLGITHLVSSFDRSLTDKELMEEMCKADVIADQFSIGSVGGIALEAMSLSRPVLVAIDTATHKVSYREPLPVLNVANDKEICEALIWVHLNREAAQELGATASDFVKRYHSGAEVAEQYIWHYERIVGRKISGEKANAPGTVK